MKRAALFAAIALFALSCRVEHEIGGRRYTVNRTWPATSITEVDLRGTNGKVIVTATDAADVTLVASVRTRRAKDSAAAETLVKSEVEDGTLYISEKRKSRRTVIILPFLTGGESAISYTLTVPKRMDLSLTNVNGTIDVKGVEGKFALRSVNGSIKVDMPAGELTARTVNGRVQAKFEREFRGAAIKTVNGAIAVSLPKESSFDCDISQVNGSFKSNVPLSSHGRRTEGAVGPEVQGGRYPLELTTVNGSVSVNQEGAGEL